MSKPRLRWLKTAGTVVSLLIAFAWMFSLVWTIGYEKGPSRAGDFTYLMFCIEAGSASIWRGMPPWDTNPGPGIGFYFDRLPRAPSRTNWLPVFERSPLPLGQGMVWTVNVPLWIPFILAAIPTLTLHRADRRYVSPGHCKKCAYNLTGNVSGKCPECGNPIAKAE